jgi:membrane protein implicated in regulation of membrane protease activity
VSDRGPGLVLILLGVGLVVLGLLLWSGWLSWFGRLPGDIRWETGRTRVYLPLVSMIVVSIILSLLAWIFRQR